MTEQNTGWRDISTAPKDGTVVRAYFPGWAGSDNQNGRAAPGQVETYWGDGAWITPGRICSDDPQPTHWQPLPPPPGEEVESEKDAAIAEAVHTIENLKGSLEVMRQGVARRDEDIEALQARCDELEAAAREACEQLKSLAYASHKATGRPLSKRPRTKMLQRPEKVRDNLLAVRKALRSVVDGGE